MKRADTEAIQIKGPQREEKGNNKESGYIGYTDQQREEKGDTNESGHRDYTVQGPAEGGEG